MATVVGQVFAAAAREGKLVILDMEAVWCHWRHVMDETAYKDPAKRTSNWTGCSRWASLLRTHSLAYIFGGARV